MVVLNVKDIPVAQAKAFIPAHYSIRLMKVSAPHAYDNEYGEGHYELNAGDAKLEGTRGEHWSPAWKKIVAKYLLADGSAINPDDLACDAWIDIQTNPDREVRKNSITWAIPAELVSDVPFKVGDLIIDPAVDMLCMGGDETGPNLDWGCWPVKKDIFADTYETL